MFKLQSITSFHITGRGTGYVVKSPISAERNFAAMTHAMGPEVEIDGVVVEPIGYELRRPRTPVFLGEEITILVRSNAMYPVKPG